MNSPVQLLNELDRWIIDLQQGVVKIGEEYWTAEKIDQLRAQITRPDVLESDTKIIDYIQTQAIQNDYQNFSREYDPNRDFFGVVLDRDKECHSQEMLEQVLASCQKQGYGFYLTNPCFEFWLLLHLLDDVHFSEEEYQRLLLNERISNNNTYVSRILSDKTHARKNISEKKFGEYYKDGIFRAVQNAENLAHTFPDLFNHLGSSLPDLIRLVFDNGEEKQED